MSMTRKIGELLIAIDNAILTVFGDDAYVTKLAPSSKYETDRILLDVTISVMKSKIPPDEFDDKMAIFDELLYNPIFHYEDALLRVNIIFEEL